MDRKAVTEHQIKLHMQSLDVFGCEDGDILVQGSHDGTSWSDQCELCYIDLYDYNYYRFYKTAKSGKPKPEKEMLKDKHEVSPNTWKFNDKE